MANPLAHIRNNPRIPKQIIGLTLPLVVSLSATVTGSTAAQDTINIQPEFETKLLPSKPDAIAPDGSEVRELLRLRGGSLAHFSLGPGETSTAVVLRTIEEIWYFVSGRGEMWRKLNGQEEIVAVGAGVSISIPMGTQFQFRNLGNEPLTAIGATMPPWPGDAAVYVVEGIWQPTVPATSAGK